MKFNLCNHRFFLPGLKFAVANRKLSDWLGQQRCLNPNGIVSFSPGLTSRRAYPGSWLKMFSTPTGLRHELKKRLQPRWGCVSGLRLPRVAPASQPWANGWNPFGILMDESRNFSLLLVCSLVIFSGCSKPATETPAPAPENVEAKSGVMLDAETQAQLGLKIESPVAAQWQPELRAVGRVVDSLALMVAAADYETTRVTGTALAQKSARAKFTADWGARFAAQTNLAAFAEQLQTDDVALVKLFLPAGVFPKPLPASAVIALFGSETNLIAAEFADDCGIDAATQTQSLLFMVKQKLPRGLAVTATLKISGEPVNGVTVPASAMLRHDGKGWVYVQTATNQFERVEVSLERPVGEGWFVTDGLSATNRLVTVGGQAVLSAEFTSGEAGQEH